MCAIIYSTHFFVLNLVGWFGVLSSKFIISLIFHYCAITLISDHQQFSVFLLEILISILFIYNSFWIVLLWRFWDFCNFTVVSYRVIDFITNQITSCFCCFWITLFELVLSASVADCLAWSRSFLAKFTSEVFTYIFTNIFTYVFSKRQKSITFYKYLICRLNWIAHHLLYFIIELITKVMFILSSISSGLELWSVNHTYYFNIWKFWVKGF